MSGDYSKEVTPVPMPNTEVKLLSVDGSRTYVPLEQNVARQEMNAMSRIECEIDILIMCTFDYLNL